MNKLIKNKLTEYIGFDIDLIINEKNDASIFGGSIRDIISNKKIHDIDILCLPNSSKRIENILFNNGYTCNDLFIMKDVYSMYKDIHCIHEPKTWIKNNKIIQIIKPNHKQKIKCIDAYNKLLGEVDISCCGVHFSDDGLKQTVPDAIYHCKYNIFKDMKLNEMYHINRFEQRKHKLVNRGWNFMDDMDKDELNKIEKLIIRDKKLKRILI